MSRTVTALFDTRADAEAGRERLVAVDIDADKVGIHDSDSLAMAHRVSADGAETSASSYSTAQEPGFWASIKNAFLPDEDRHTYEEGVRRGGFLLTVDVDDDEVDKAVAALEDTNSVDIEERSQTWRNDGWAAPMAAGSSAGIFAGGPPRDDMPDGDQSSSTNGDRPSFGDREAGRGGTRSRSYVTDRPAHEQIRHHEERDMDGPDRGTDADGNRDEVGVGTTLAGLANEAIGNVKQGIGGAVGSESLTENGQLQEHKGEAQQGKNPRD